MTNDEFSNIATKNYLKMSTGNNLEERLILFAVKVLDLFDKLPSNMAGRHLGSQFVRSGTSPALNYGEAREAESKKDFIHKLKVCLKELKETQICLRIMIHKPMLNPATIEPVLKECNELVAIFVQSVKTARRS